MKRVLPVKQRVVIHIRRLFSIGFVLLAGVEGLTGVAKTFSAETVRTYAFPSPARNTCVRLAYQLFEAGHVDIRVYNERGNMVARLSEEGSPGWKIRDLGLCRLPPGIYRHFIWIHYPSGLSETLKGEPFAVLH